MVLGSIRSVVSALFFGLLRLRFVLPAPKARAAPIAEQPQALRGGTIDIARWLVELCSAMGTH